VNARGLRLAIFTDTFAPQVNGVSRTLERLVQAVEARGGAMRAEMGASDGDLVVAYVGRLAPEKGVLAAIEAMQRLRVRHGRRVRYAFAGDGPHENRCRSLAPEGTWFAGSLRGERLSAFYASADVLIFPSTTETFGNVVLEAMASGVPVIAPNRGATLEMAHRASAELFLGGDVDSLEDALERLLRDAARREALRTAGLAEAASRTWDAVWDGLLADFREAIREPLKTAA
jgi:glycosyltransferase involved in cell wall biosynthesis